MYLIQKLKNIYYFTKAKHYIQSDNLSEALLTINKMKSRDKTYFLMMRGTIFFLMSKNTEAMSDYESALILLNKDSTRNYDEVNYLKSYNYYNLFIIYRNLKNTQKCEELDVLYQESMNFDINNIKKHLLYDFPLASSEKWEKKINSGMD